MQQLRALASELSEVYGDLHGEHLARNAANREFSGWKGIVRHVSEALGEGDENFPSIKLWHLPKEQLDQGIELLDRGDVEGAAGLLMKSQVGMSDVATRFVKYETRVVTGASTAMRWAGRLKTLGNIAAGLAGGPLGIVRASVMAGAYNVAQEGLQQASSVHFGQQESMRWGELAKGAAVTTVMSMFGGAITARFKTAILSRLGDPAAESIVNDYLASAMASSTSSVYQVPVEVVLRNAIEGKPLPTDASQLAEMVLDAAVTNGVIDAATKHISARIELGARGPRENAATTEGAELKALAEAVAPAGGRGAGAATGDTRLSSGAAPQHEGAEYRPDDRFAGGLQGEQAKKRIAHQAFEAYQKQGLNDPAKYKSRAGIEQVVRTIEPIVAQELAPSGMPMPKIKVEAMTNAGTYGSYDASTNTLRVNAFAVNAKTKKHAFIDNPAAFQELLGLVVHETRHAQQVFLALRVQAGRSPGLDPSLVRAALHNEADVAPELVDAAVRTPIAPSDVSAEAALGREIWAESFATGARRDLQRWAQQVSGESDARMSEVSRLMKKANELRTQGATQEYRDLVEAATELSRNVEEACQHYRGLAEEVDARRTELHIEGIFSAKLRLQLEVNELSAHLSAAQDALRRLTPYPDSAVDALVGVLRWEQKMRDVLQNQVALMPVDAQTVAATAAAAQGAGTPKAR